jgi:hypothetical protein
MKEQKIVTLTLHELLGIVYAYFIEKKVLAPNKYDHGNCVPAPDFQSYNFTFFTQDKPEVDITKPEKPKDDGLRKIIVGDGDEKSTV